MDMLKDVRSKNDSKLLEYEYQDDLTEKNNASFKVKSVADIVDQVS